MTTNLKAPFPWYGGKTRWVNDVIERFGNVEVYAEPFAGSLAVLLGSPPRNREVICDTDGMVCNAWRAIQNAPDCVAYWADYPTFHQDLTARRYWLVEWREQYGARLSLDMDFFCPRAAGLWIWCLSSWIGASGDMLKVNKNGLARDKRPRVYTHMGATGVQADRSNLPFHDKRPKVYDSNGGVGVQVQVLSKNLRPYTNTNGGRGVQVQRQELSQDKVPTVMAKTGGRGVQAQRQELAEGNARPYCTWGGGRGVQVQRQQVMGDQIPAVASWTGGQGVNAQRKQLEGRIGDGSRLSDWMYALADRLARVVVLNRDWTSAVTPVILQHTPTGPKPAVGVFLDPPYLLDNRLDGLYTNDTVESNTARAAYEWAVANGDTYRIAYCCKEGDFPVPDGWTAIYRTLGGIRDVERREQLDCVLFSPACEDPEKREQPRLF